MKKINVKLRLKNKATLTALIAVTVAFIYQILGLFGVAPAIAEDTVTQALGLVIDLLIAVGIIVDPTTAGVGDTELALGYTEPRKENV